MGMLFRMFIASLCSRSYTKSTGHCIFWEDVFRTVVVLVKSFPCSPGQFFVYFLPEGQKINHNYNLPSKNLQKIATRTVRKTVNRKVNTITVRSWHKGREINENVFSFFLVVNQERLSFAFSNVVYILYLLCQLRQSYGDFHI